MTTLSLWLFYPTSRTDGDIGRVWAPGYWSQQECVHNIYIAIVSEMYLGLLTAKSADQTKNALVQFRVTIVGRKSELKKFWCLSSLVSTQPVRAPSSAAVRKVEACDERHKIAYSSHFLPPIKAWPSTSSFSAWSHREKE